MACQAVEAVRSASAASRQGYNEGDRTMTVRERLIQAYQRGGYDTLTACEWADKTLAEAREYFKTNHMPFGFTIRGSGEHLVLSKGDNGKP